MNIIIYTYYCNIWYSKQGAERIAVSPDIMKILIIMLINIDCIAKYFEKMFNIFIAV